MPDLTSTYLEQIEAILNEYRDLEKKRENSGFYAVETQRLITLCRAAVYRVTGPDSQYAAQLSELLDRRMFDKLRIPLIVGVVEALQADLKAGYMKTVSELLHGEVFGDFLEMADHLLESEYKDAAAVMSGSTLEAHLRQLCQKFRVETEVADGEGNLRPKKADRMNSELTKAEAYSKLDQKSVTAWLDLRNKAAHGKYDEYDLKQVALLNQGVRDFISRNPA